jgi:amino acid permease
MSNLLNSIAFIANILNIVLATGVFTLPFSIWETGIILGGIVLLIIALLSFITSSFLVESCAIANSIYRQEQEIFSEIVSRASIKSTDRYTYLFETNFHAFLNSKEDKSNTISSFRSTNKIQVSDDTNESALKENEEVKDNSKKVENSKEVNEKLSNLEEEKDNFYVFKRMEILKMSKSVLNKPLYFSFLFIMIGYLYISLTSNAVLMSNSLEQILIKTFDMTPIKNGKVGMIYYIVLGCYYLMILTISQRNIKELQKFTSIIMAARMTVILLIFCSCIYILSQYGITEYSTIPKFNFKNITLMIGNTLFYFMIQHSVPGIIEGVRPQKSLMKLLFFSFVIAFIVFYAYGIVTTMTFGKYTNCDLDNQFPSAIMNYFNLNFLHFNAIGYIINYYPLFNIITGSIQMITLKNNIVVAVSGCYQDFQRLYEENKKVRFIMISYII